MLLTAALFAALSVGAGSALASSGHMTGTVTSASTGQPLSGVEVCAEGPSSECTETDEGGQYSLDGLEPGEYTVKFNPQSGPYFVQYHAGKGKNAADPIEVSPEGPAVEVNEQMHTYGAISGTVTSLETGVPLQGAAVCVQLDENGFEDKECTASDSGGHYAITGLIPGGYSVEIRPTGEAVLPSSAEPRQVTVTELQTAQADAAFEVLEATAPPTIAGAGWSGQTLTEGHAAWTLTPTAFDYQWSRCDAVGEGCQAIPGASEETYIPTSADVGHELRVGETARITSLFTEVEPPLEELLARSTAISEPTAVVEAAIVPGPTAETEAASSVSATGATLNGNVNPKGSEVGECQFEYGTSTAYGEIAPCPTAPGAGTDAVPEAAPVIGLVANTEYHFRIVAATGAGSSQGEDETFLTVPHRPSVSAVGPGAGLEAGGTAVTITGSEFTHVTAVRFGAATATHFTVDSSTQITADAPAGKGTVDVTVTTTGGASSTGPADQFSYVPLGPPPTISALSAKKGPAGGGTGVIIGGADFVGVTAVRFGSTSARSIRVESTTSISAVAPAETTGPVSITVTTPNGTSAVSKKTTFTFEAPTVAALSVSAGPKSGGTQLTVTGSGFEVGAGLTAFQFGKVSASDVECGSTTTCTVTAPPAVKVGAVDVRAKVGKKTSRKSPPGDRFSYG